MIAEALGKFDFKGSVGWQEKWKKRFSIKYFKICGESGGVQGVTIDSWKERPPELVRGYSKNDIIGTWTRQVCFFVLYLIMALPKKVVVAREERNPSRGLQLLFCVCFRT